MAIARIKKGFYLTALSTDDKPTTGIPIYSYIMETDTGDIYVYRYTGSGTTKAWVKLLD